MCVFSKRTAILSSFYQTKFHSVMKNRIYPFLLLTIIALSGCARYILDEEDVASKGDSQLTIRISPFEKSSFDINPTSRATVGINEICSRIGFAVFDSNGKKVASVNQDSKTGGFGTLKANLNDGVYEIVIVAHSTGGNATISKPDSIRFTDNKVTDTFYYYEQINLNGSLTKDITMKRCVGMLRLNLNESIPADVKQLKFEYSGGSSALNAKTGFGRIQSRQTEYRSVAADAATATRNTFDIYTIPHEKDDVLKITITALAADGKTELLKTVLEDVPVTQGMITNYNGSIFGGGTSIPGTGEDSLSPFNISLKADKDWTEQTFNF